MVLYTAKLIEEALDLRVDCSFYDGAGVAVHHTVYDAIPRLARCLAYSTSCVVVTASFKV